MKHANHSDRHLVGVANQRVGESKHFRVNKKMEMGEMLWHNNKLYHNIKTTNL